MNGIKYVADTNCFIYLLDENSAILPFAEGGWAFSFITEIELLSKKGITTAEDKLIKGMLSVCYKVNHTQHLSDLTISLKRKNNIKLPDAIIAATSLILGIPLITADKGFKNISGIDCLIIDLEE